jgi:hypothetical protein
MEKKMLILALMAFALIAILPGALAATLTLSPTQVDLGGAGAARDTFYTATFTVKNTGIDTATGISIVSSGVASKYNMTFSNVPETLAPNASQIVTVSAFMPLSKNSASEKIGSIVASASNAGAATASVYMQAENKLDIYDADIDVEGKSEDIDCTGTSCSYSIDENAKPEDTLTITLKFENLFTNDDKIDIQNINVDAIIEGIDDGDDLDPDTSIKEFDLRYDTKVTKAMTFKLPTKIDEDTYDIVIDVEGEDENGATHESHWTLSLNVERDSHDLVTRDINPQQMASSCERVLPLSLNVYNRGSSDEDNVVVIVSNTQLGIAIKDEFALNSDEEYTSFFNIIVPQNTVPATYNILIKTYYDYNNQMSIYSIPIVVTKCNATTPVTPVTPSQNTTIITPVVPTGDGAAVAQKVPFTDSTAFMVLLVAAVIALLIIIFVIIAKLIR